MILFDLTGKRALVTGSSQGVGLAIATGLAEAGAHVILNGRRAARLLEASADLSASGHDVDMAAFDVTEAQAVERGIQEIENRVGPIEILVNNAGVQCRQILEDFPEYEWSRLVATNLPSAFFVSRAVVKGMIGRRSGKIINIASVQAELGRQTIAPYAATRAPCRCSRKACAQTGGDMESRPTHWRPAISTPS